MAPDVIDITMDSRFVTELAFAGPCKVIPCIFLLSCSFSLCPSFEAEIDDEDNRGNDEVALEETAEAWD